ncbi:MAG: hypothetical protein A3K06_03580 [Candidatus Doudnabacteria bacterium RIFCSPHIGHO2_01_52_17]|uniref:Uncharacterized protein n=1 Tax=Candidatus Doudnabacteria bacterium RIFCSPHIGHO2_01_52_17 TaxID=1817820 RepID=A0A1F5NFU3_9BACT|nr:MAG: hypothetical protein UY73_C0029G0003 [Parcubacteria group bacterium GW2011_GWA2_52_8]OGE76561.1 MAG: hypothetical protein A3K06_03580 [Candidatus Doudnabacteria bacterium RIFCSPHIGHO2_01_52_17]
MKKTIYIIAFTFLGILSQFILHAWVEMIYIRALLRDYGSYGLGLSWSDWDLVHRIVSVILLIAGVAFGFWQGQYWWRQIYPHTKSRNV